MTAWRYDFTTGKARPIDPFPFPRVQGTLRDASDTGIPFGLDLSGDGRYAFFQTWAHKWLLTTPFDSDIYSSWVKDLVTGEAHLINSSTYGDGQPTPNDATAFVTDDGNTVLMRREWSGQGARLERFAVALGGGTPTAASVDLDPTCFSGSSLPGDRISGSVVYFNNVDVDGDVVGPCLARSWSPATSTYALVATAGDGTPADAQTEVVASSPDGRYILLWSLASNLAVLPSGATPPLLYVKDMQSGTVTPLAALAVAGIPYTASWDAPPERAFLSSFTNAANGYVLVEAPGSIPELAGHVLVINAATGVASVADRDADDVPLCGAFSPRGLSRDGSKVLFVGQLGSDPGCGAAPAGTATAWPAHLWKDLVTGELRAALTTPLGMDAGLGNANAVLAGDGRRTLHIGPEEIGRTDGVRHEDYEATQAFVRQQLP